MWRCGSGRQHGSIPRTRHVAPSPRVTCHVSSRGPPGPRTGRINNEPSRRGTQGDTGKKAPVLSYCHGEMPSSSVVITPSPVLTGCPVSSVHRAQADGSRAEWLEWSGSEQTSITTHISPAQQSCQQTFANFHISSWKGLLLESFYVLSTRRMPLL